ncbi:RVT_2 domain-containing protein [Gossypium australe]|uniref:RVT_2 domain-containing protein n=1 Tax=Gossypium australe TaxID=47621 RepID=A0A5B6WTP8_9ROSI|nr:RVT_2 domain-containing protein [Gossypium australe]
MVAQIYADDIIFGSTSTNVNDSFVKIMQNEFEMSMNGIFLSQEKYAKNLIKTFEMEEANLPKSPM